MVNRNKPTYLQDYIDIATIMSKKFPEYNYPGLFLSQNDRELYTFDNVKSLYNSRGAMGLPKSILSKIQKYEQWMQKALNDYDAQYCDR